MDIDHTPIDIEVVDQPEHLDGERLPDFVKYALSRAIQLAPCRIDAEYDWRAKTPVEWNLRSYLPGEEPRVLGSMDRGRFRSLLAFIGFEYLGGEPYGGAMTRRLRQGKREVYARFDTSNDNRFGNWLRIDLSAPLER